MSVKAGWAVLRSTKSLRALLLAVLVLAPPGVYFFRSQLGAIPAVRRTAKYLHRKWARIGFDSTRYWEQRYASGGNSGAWSHGRFAEYKAEILNDFVEKNGIQSVFDLGCGDGSQLRLARYPRYTGLDVSPTAILRCQSLFRNERAVKNFVLYKPGITDVAAYRSDLALSLGVIFHLVEDRIFDIHMRDLFLAAERYVIIRSDNVDADDVNPYIRHRKFSLWIDRNCPHWKLLRHIPNRSPQDGWAEFYIYGRKSGTPE
jgi:SAM-dependent methyltransferase